MSSRSLSAVRSLRRLLVPALAAAAVLTVAGCADSGDGNSTGDPSSDANDAFDGFRDTASDATSQTCGSSPCPGLCCGGVCIDEDQDPNNCGGCGRVCSIGESCVGGTCASSCGDQPGFFTCLDLCVDFQNDPLHCGNCTTACGASQVCADGVCAGGCNAGKSACNGRCVDLQSSETHCGACNMACGGGQMCIDGVCGCAPGFSDCDGDPANGCETAGACACSPGESRSCYSGIDGTEGVGPCQGGTQTCSPDGTAWGECVGEVRPVTEICGNGVDDNCDGEVDEDPDEDGDGFTVCGGDCCDLKTTGCAADPARVNPAAYDFDGNNLDDNCDGVADNAPATTCSSGELVGNTGMDLAKAMELCTVSQNGSWGLVSAEILRADGSGTPLSSQTGVLRTLGNVIPAQAGDNMAALSSGTARGVGQIGYVDPNVTYDAGTSDSAPSRYLSAHNNQLQAAPGCPSGDSTVHDSVLLRLTLKAPTNANGFSFNFRFLSSEYPEYLCSQYNDFFLALLDSQHPDIPADGNISFDEGSNPISVNNAFFTACQPQSCGYFHYGTDNDFDGCPDSLSCQSGQCASSLGACPDGPTDITGYTSYADGSGGTSWLTTQAGVMPGETFTLEFHIWDTSDHELDSIVLLDNFEWRIEPTTVKTFN